MAINRFYRRNPYEGQLYSLPVAPQLQLMQMTKQAYDMNYSDALKLKNNYIDALPQDRAEANALQQKYANKVDEIVNRHGGDYAKIGKSLRELQAEAMSDFAPGSKGAAIVTQKRIYDDWRKRNEERVAKGDVLPEDVSLGSNEFMRNYKGVSSNEDGVYAPTMIEDVAEFSDPNKLFMDVQSKITPEKTKIQYTKFENGFVKDITEEVETKSPQKLKQAFGTALMSDKKTINYLRQQARYRGLNPSSTLQYVDDLTTSAATSYAYRNISSGTKTERDPMALAAYKAKLDADNIKLKHSLDNSIDNPSNGLEFGQDIPINAKKQLDPKNWKSNLFLDQVIYSSPTSAQVRTGMEGNYTKIQSTIPAQEKNLFSLYKNDSLAADKINKSALKLAVRNYAQSMKFDVDKMSEIQLKSFINANEENIIQSYNAIDKDVNAGKSFYKPLNDRIIPQVSDRAFRSLLSQSPVTFVDADGKRLENVNLKQLLDEGKITMEDIVDDKGKRKSDVFGYSVLGGLYSNTPGYMMNVYGKDGAKGTIVVHDQSVQRKDLYNNIGNAMKEVTFGGKSISSPFRVGSNMLVAHSNLVTERGQTKNQLSFSRLDRDGNSYPLYYEDLFSNDDGTRMGIPGINDENKTPLSVIDFQEMLMPEYIKAQPYSYSKKDESYSRQPQ